MNQQILILHFTYLSRPALLGVLSVREKRTAYTVPFNINQFKRLERCLPLRLRVPKKKKTFSLLSVGASSREKKSVGFGTIKGIRGRCVVGSRRCNL